MKITRRRYLVPVLIALALAFVLAVVTSGLLLRGARVDLTANHLYTLSDGSKRVIAGIQSPVTLHLYYSRRAAQALPRLYTYADRVQQLLEEVAAHSDGKITLQVTDPPPFSEAEDRASADGLQAVPLNGGGETLFFGLVGTNAQGDKSVMPFLQPGKEAFLEYDLAKLIAALGNPERPVLALLSTLPMGPGIGPDGQPTTGWVIDAQLRELFEVRRLPLTTTSIGDEVDVLMVVHPKHLGDDALYAIDQFVLGGGHLLAFVDPESEADPEGAGDPLTALTADHGSTLGRLFDAWGVRFDPTRVVLDGTYALQSQPDPQRPPVRNLSLLGLGQDVLNQHDVVSAQIEALNLASAGAFEIAEDAGVTLQPLAQSSGNAAMIAASELRQTASNPQALYDDFQATGKRYVLAARLTGSLRTAFPDRAGSAHSGDRHLQISTGAANIILVADTDLLSDRLWVQVQDFLGQRVLNAFANNGDFVFNAADNLAGNDDLISVRTRPAAARQFTRVEELRRRAEQRFRSTEQELQRELVETQRKLDQLQGPAGTGTPAVAPTGAQHDELARFQQRKAHIRSELRQVRRGLDADIERLGMRMKLFNILVMPALVTLLAIGFALWRRRRRNPLEAGAGAR